MKWFLKLLDNLGRKRIVLDRASEEPYLERYYLFLKDRKRFPFNIFLHKFLKSDPDDLHDHPWLYATLILKARYYEWIPKFAQQGHKLCEVAVWRGPGSFRICGANSFHRIELDPNVTAWTLFMPGPQQREWGFATRKGWVRYDQYIQEKSAT